MPNPTPPQPPESQLGSSGLNMSAYRTRTGSFVFREQEAAPPTPLAWKIMLLGSNQRSLNVANSDRIRAAIQCPVQGYTLYINGEYSHQQGPIMQFAVGDERHVVGRMVLANGHISLDQDYKRARQTNGGNFAQVVSADLLAMVKEMKSLIEASPLKSNQRYQELIKPNVEMYQELFK